ncbi:hypothetical protein GPALN_013086 [Globodera pallida]|nr:hypothetical protein GPALN_013086 [Globodera pallida]
MGECSSNNTEPKPSQKWTCAYCTYRNWEAGLKCVICCQPRNRPMIIEEIGAIEDFSKNLSFGSTTMSTTAPPALSSDRLVEDAAPRWSCPSCTYLNCRRTKRCVICDTERPSRFVDQTPPGSGENQTNRNETFGGGAQFVLSKELLNKWSCAACTFDNWPTAPKCTICGRSRSMPAGGDENEAMATDKKSRQRLSRTPSPKDSGTADNSTNNSEQQKHLERLNSLSIGDHHYHQNEQQQHNKGLDYTSALDIYVRRYLGNEPVEKLFFRAMRAIGQGELQMVNRVVDFLINDGNLQRALTAFEARLLNQRGAAPIDCCTFERADSLLFLAKKCDSPELLKLCRCFSSSASLSSGGGDCVTADDDNSSNDISALPCALNCMARTRLYTRVTQCLAFRDGAATFKCQFVAHPHNFSILKLPPQSAGSCADDLALTVQTAILRPAPSIPPQFCYLDCFDSMANRGGVIVGRPPNFLMRNRGGPNTLYDAIFQCMFGVCDRFNILRSALKYTLRRSSHLFKIRWLDAQLKMARDCGLSSFGQGDMENDWADVLNAVDADDECPEPIHIWALAHVVCRPIVVHSMDDPIDVDQLLAAVNSQSMPGGDETDANLALAKRQHNAPQNHYEGIYLPVLWASPPVTRSPLFICHRNGHFHAVVVSDDIYQRDFEVQRYLRIVRRAPRRPGVPEPLFRFLTRAEADNSAFLSQFVLFGECSVAHLSIRREAHPFLPEALALYRGWLHALLQAADDMEAAPMPCSTRAAVMPQLATRIDAHAQQQQHQKNWRAHAHNTAVSALLASAVTQQQAGATAAPISRQRSFAYSSATGRLQQQQQDADGDEQRQHSDGEE